MTDARRDLVTTTLGVLSIGALIVTSFLIVQSFLGAIIWATMLVVATWPVMLKLQALLWNRRAFAATAMTLLLLVIVVLPMALALSVIVSHSPQIGEWVMSIPDFRLPPIPDRIASMPVAGTVIAATWQQLSDMGFNEVMAKLNPDAAAIAKWTIGKFGSVGLLFVQFLLTAIIAAIMYNGGETAADAVKRFGRRLAGERGESMVVLASQAIRSVALGVGVTAVVQSALGGIGLAIAGVPGTGLLTAVMFMLCIAQVGPSLILFPAVIWVYWTGDSGWGTFLLVWSIVVSLIDNVLRPMLIKKGADLPILLMLVGVIGGMFAFGLIGIFIGPVVLAVAYTLVGSWISEGAVPVPDGVPGSIIHEP